MSRLCFTLLLSVVHLALSEHIDSRALRIFNNSKLVANIECDSRVDDYQCDRFTLFHVYVYAAKVPPSGAKGYITDEPQFACGPVDPPRDSSDGWAAVVKYSTKAAKNCDCSYEKKILQVQAAGYTLALLVGTNNCSDYLGEYDSDEVDHNNNTRITIPAVLVSQHLGKALVKHSVPTNTTTSASRVVILVHYVNYHNTAAVIAFTAGVIGVLFIAAAIVCYVNRHKLRHRTGQYKTLPEDKKSTKKFTSKPTDEPVTTTSVVNNTDGSEEAPQFTASQNGYTHIHLQRVNSPLSSGYGSVTDAYEPQLKLQADDKS